MGKLKNKKGKSGRRIRPHEDVPHVNYDKLPPVFSLRHLEASHGLGNCTTEQKAGVLDAFHIRRNLTWVELFSTHRRGLGSENIPQPAIGVMLPACITPEMTLMAFRCIERMRMVGFRDQDRFHVVWFDWNMNLYDHG